VPNEGTRTKAEYGKAVKLEADGKPINVGNDSHPVAADWDKDGLLDLVVGTGAGSVLWYRNVGGKDAPKLAAPVTLVPEIVREDNSWTKPPKEGQWGMRAKICVTDWNNDGWPDLLVGDFTSWSGPEPKLTDEQKARKKELEAKLNKVYDDPEYRKITERYS